MSKHGPLHVKVLPFLPSLHPLWREEWHGLQPKINSDLHMCHGFHAEGIIFVSLMHCYIMLLYRSQMVFLKDLHHVCENRIKTSLIWWLDEL